MDGSPNKTYTVLLQKLVATLWTRLVRADELGKSAESAMRDPSDANVRPVTPARPLRPRARSLPVLNEKKN